MSAPDLGSINPSREQFDAFKALPRDQPIHMLNLIRLRAVADYPQGHPDHDKGLTGLQAYRSYGRATKALFARLGGRQVWAGAPQVVVTGPQDEAWDIAFIAEYPSGAAFLAMVTDPQYQIDVQHRTAAVADSRLIRFSPVEAGEGFGE